MPYKGGKYNPNHAPSNGGQNMPPSLYSPNTQRSSQGPNHRGNSNSYDTAQTRGRVNVNPFSNQGQATALSQQQTRTMVADNQRRSTKQSSPLHKNNQRQGVGLQGVKMNFNPFAQGSDFMTGVSMSTGMSDIAIAEANQPRQHSFTSIPPNSVQQGTALQLPNGYHNSIDPIQRGMNSGYISASGIGSGSGNQPPQGSFAPVLGLPHINHNPFMKGANASVNNYCENLSSGQVTTVTTTDLDGIDVSSVLSKTVVKDIDLLDEPEMPDPQDNVAAATAHLLTTVKKENNVVLMSFDEICGPTEGAYSLMLKTGDQQIILTAGNIPVRAPNP